MGWCLNSWVCCAVGLLAMFPFIISLLSFPFYHSPFIIAFIIAVVLLAMSPFVIALHRGKNARGHVTLNKHLAFLKFCLYEVAAEHFIATF